MLNYVEEDKHVLVKPTISKTEQRIVAIGQGDEIYFLIITKEE